MVLGKVADAIDGFLDRERRKPNLVIHNLPGQAGDPRMDRCNADMSEFTRMIRECFRLKVHTKSSFPAGKASTGRHRLLIVTLDSEEDKHTILRLASQFRDSARYGQIYITPDLTWQERQKGRQMTVEPRRHREQGATDLAIRSGRICKRDTADKTLPSKTGSGGDQASTVLQFQASKENRNTISTGQTLSCFDRC